MSDDDPHVRYPEEIERLEAEVRRLRALLTAPPDEAEIREATEEVKPRYALFGSLHGKAIELSDNLYNEVCAVAVATAFACRARKIGGDTDE